MGGWLMPPLWKRVRNVIAGRLRDLGSPGRAAPWDSTFENPDPEDSAHRFERAPHAGGRDDPDPRLRALAILELGPAANGDEIRSAYRRLCRRYHPDRFARDEAKSLAANELLAEINLAYQVLTDG
jgi:DnaJ-domain-containing protein 1